MFDSRWNDDPRDRGDEWRRDSRDRNDDTGASPQVGRGPSSEKEQSHGDMRPRDDERRPERDRDPRDQEPRQAFYSGLKREREVEHDSQVYRAFEREAERLAERDVRIDRVVLDYELKREYQQWLHERDRDRDDYDGHPDRDAEEIAQWALEHDLPYFDDQ